LHGFLHRAPACPRRRVLRKPDAALRPGSQTRDTHREPLHSGRRRPPPALRIECRRGRHFDCRRCRPTPEVSLSRKFARRTCALHMCSPVSLRRQRVDVRPPGWLSSPDHEPAPAHNRWGRVAEMQGPTVAAHSHD
jgi:hypothetical protein